MFIFYGYRIYIAKLDFSNYVWIKKYWVSAAFFFNKFYSTRTITIFNKFVFKWLFRGEFTIYFNYCCHSSSCKFCSFANFSPIDWTDSLWAPLWENMADEKAVSRLYWIRRHGAQHLDPYYHCGRRYRSHRSTKVVKLGEIDVAVDIELPFAVFIRNSSLYTLIVVLPPIINAVLNDFLIDDSTFVSPNTSYWFFTVDAFRYSCNEYLQAQSFLVSLQWISENSGAFGFVIVGDYVRDPSP